MATHRHQHPKRVLRDLGLIFAVLLLAGLVLEFAGPAMRSISQARKELVLKREVQSLQEVYRPRPRGLRYAAWGIKASGHDEADVRLLHKWKENRYKWGVLPNEIRQEIDANTPFVVVKQWRETIKVITENGISVWLHTGDCLAPPEEQTKGSARNAADKPHSGEGAASSVPRRS